MLEVTLRRAGRSVVLVLPKNVTDMLHLEVGDSLSVGIEEGRVILTPKPKADEALLDAPALDALLKQVAEGAECTRAAVDEALAYTPEPLPPINRAAIRADVENELGGGVGERLLRVFGV